jgi:hypothetical protein
MNYIVFIAMALLSYSATEVIKAVVNVYFPNLKIGMILALVFGILFSFGYGIGLVSAVSKVEYSTVLIPYLFMVVDLIGTGAILSLGSKGINSFLEHFGIDISGGIKNEVEKYLATKEN